MKLAGGGSRRFIVRPWEGAPAGAMDSGATGGFRFFLSAAPTGAGELLIRIRWLTPPAKFRCPSGTGTSLRDGNESKSA
jgi:hypothetical protein